MEPARKRRNREHTNSRNGCTQCKARKVKCDEEKPKCRACTRRNASCTYSNDGLNQLANAASHASPHHERQESSAGFTPIQSELRTTPLSNNSIAPELSANFTPVQQELPTITPLSDVNRTAETPHRAFQPQMVAHRTLPSPLNMGHMELLHHFIAVTATAISPGSPGREIWHMTVPRIALSHEWLMHSILAVSALHIAHLRPEKCRMYRQRAAMHQDQALQGQQKALAKPTSENGDALFAFTLVITYLAFAAVESPESAEERPLQGAIRCLHMLQGIRTIHSAVNRFVEQGPLGPLLNIHPGNIKSNPLFRDQFTEAHFSSLLIFASTNGDVNDDQEMHDTESYAGAASSLRASFLKVEAVPKGQPITPPIWSWAARLSHNFVTRFGEGKAVPLVLVAHWCVLLAQVPHYWFISGWVDQTMGEITLCLAQVHRQWLDWPNEKIREFRRRTIENGR